jgi:glycosyltransferase involved in cell wall biosynthesis
MHTALEIVFWVCAGLIVWTQLGYAAALAALTRLFARKPTPTPAPEEPLPSLSLIVAAHDEQASIAAKLADALAQDYPRELLEVIVACDGCADATAQRAREAGADLVLELARGGKIRAQDAAVARARGAIVAFSDANALWEPDAARALVAAFADPRVGYACGQVRFSGDPHPPAAAAAAGSDSAVQGSTDGAATPTNQEGVYWRYELAVRALESRLCSVTAGNGAIYATRRDTYLVVDPIMGHDLSFPFNMVKRGWRAVYVPWARATERMVPSIEGELRRKRRMMSHTWPIVLRGGMLSPRGYPPGYALMILSHRLLRYLTPFLHALALAANIALVALAAGPHALYVATLAAQLGLLAAAGLGGVVEVVARLTRIPAIAKIGRPLLIARYYALTTAALALGLLDWLRHGTAATWEAAEGTRPVEAPPAVAR